MTIVEKIFATIDELSNFKHLVFEEITHIYDFSCKNTTGYWIVKSNTYSISKGDQ